MRERSDHIFGFVLVNDWSARDIQRWEYQPLGPFLGKSFATTVSPFVVSPEALKPYRIEMPDRPELLPYLRPAGQSLRHHDGGLRERLAYRAQTNTRDLYWTFDQMIAHHTSNGCNLQRGDLLASGTVSGPDSFGCLLESGLAYLKDGDEVVMRAYAQPGPAPNRLRGMPRNDSASDQKSNFAATCSSRGLRPSTRRTNKFE